jgi:hypothetical protein
MFVHFSENTETCTQYTAIRSLILLMTSMLDSMNKSYVYVFTPPAVYCYVYVDDTDDNTTRCFFTSPSSVQNARGKKGTDCTLRVALISARSTRHLLQLLAPPLSVINPKIFQTSILGAPRNYNSIFSPCPPVHLYQCCATFLHSRHTKYCRRVMAAHQPHFAYWGGGGEMIYGIYWPRQFLINRPQSKKCSIWCS